MTDKQRRFLTNNITGKIKKSQSINNVQWKKTLVQKKKPVA